MAVGVLVHLIVSFILRLRKTEEFQTNEKEDVHAEIKKHAARSRYSY